MAPYGISIRRWLFALVVTAGAVIALASAIAHFTLNTKMAVAAVERQLERILLDAEYGFHRTHVLPLTGMLRILESSPEVDRILIANGADALLDRPPAEQLLLSIANADSKRILSLRLVDAMGQERIVVAGRHRVRRYHNLFTDSSDPVGVRMAALLTRLRDSPPGTIRAKGLLQEAGQGRSFLLGITKREPDIGGFGGALIAHVSVEDYMKGLTELEVYGHPVAWVLDRNGSVLQRPPGGAAASVTEAEFAAELARPEADQIHASSADPEGPLMGLFRIAVVMPRALYHEQIRRTAATTLAILALLVVVAAAFAYVAARRVDRPLSALLAGTDAVGSGNLDVRLPTRWTGEFGRLAEAFNGMLDALQRSTVSKADADNILGSMSDMLLVTDHNLVIRQVNGALLGALDYDAAQVIGQSLHAVVDPQMARTRTIGPSPPMKRRWCNEAAS